MATSITQNGTTIELSGAHKSGVFLAGSTTSTVSVGPSVTSDDDVGRYIIWKLGGVLNESRWQFRQIISISSTEYTVHSPFSVAPSENDPWVVSTSLDDIDNAGVSNHTKVGDRSHFINGDFTLMDNCYLAMENEHLECRLGSDIAVMQHHSGTAWSMGTLWGGEANNSTEVTGGCGLTMTTTSASLVSFGGADFSCSRNFFGSVITLVKTRSGGRMFMRLQGTSRLIGCNFDGDIGGRLYGATTEWVNCQMTGNETLQVAWSLAAQFDRPITNVIWGQGSAAAKNYLAFSGTFRDCTFSR